MVVSLWLATSFWGLVGHGLGVYKGSVVVLLVLLLLILLPACLWVCWSSLYFGVKFVSGVFLP